MKEGENCGAKKIKVNFPEETYADLEELGKEFNLSVPDVIRVSLGLMKRVAEERKHGNSLAFVRGTTVLKEIILPEARRRLG